MRLLWVIMRRGPCVGSAWKRARTTAPPRPAERGGEGGRAWERSLRLRGLQCVEHSLRMARDLHRTPRVGDGALGVDQEGAALDAEHLAAVHRLFLDDAEGLAQRFVGVAHEFETETLLLAEVAVRAHRVAGNA